uniref:Uncharacterized protein n=1 Tax=Timema poppense TaxID=170557 RepID=A0A7R9DL57_TIMPO|nr:unnamed protein product [Timema poppensis]
MAIKVDCSDIRLSAASIPPSTVVRSSPLSSTLSFSPLSLGLPLTSISNILLVILSFSLLYPVLSCLLLTPPYSLQPPVPWSSPHLHIQHPPGHPFLLPSLSCPILSPPHSSLGLPLTSISNILLVIPFLHYPAYVQRSLILVGTKDENE